MFVITFFLWTVAGFCALAGLLELRKDKARAIAQALLGLIFAIPAAYLTWGA